MYLQAKLDNFLNSEPVKSALKLPRCKGLNGFSAMADVINKHSEEIIRAEIEFFQNYTPDTNPVINFYQNLLKGIDEARKNKDMFIVRLAWGSGWRGMTGNWLAPQELDVIRPEAKLGKRGVDIFPKTRRLAVQDGFPHVPLGWVLVQPAEDSLFHREPVAIAAPEPEKPEEKVPSSTPPEPKPEEKAPEPVIRETWENATVSFTPNDGVITATKKDTGQKATEKNKELVPENLRKKLFKQKKAVKATVTVEPYGNAFTIVKVE
jgi:hypothetical protein